MRRLLRIFFHAVTMLLAVFTLAALVAWPVSYYWGTPHVSHTRHVVDPSAVPSWMDLSVWVEEYAFVTRGVLVFGRVTYDEPLNLPYMNHTPHVGWTYGRNVQNWWVVIGPWHMNWPAFYGGLGKWSQDAYAHCAVSIPLWWLALGFGAMPGFRLQRFTRRAICARRRRRAGLCAECGYDLRASPERCPECGIAAAAHG